MGILNNSYDTQIAEYDFAKDGGALGVHKMGLVLEEFSLINYVAWAVIDTFTGPGAIVSSGALILNQNPVVVGFPAFMAPTVATTLTAAMSFPSATAVFAVRNTAPLEFYFGISVAPVLSGRILVYASYFNSDL